MERLWAPWRMAYLRPDPEEQGEGGCVLCLPADRDHDRRRLVLHRGEHAYVIMNRYPYSNGHLMVAPLRHVADLGDLTDAEAQEMHRLLTLARDVLQKRLAPHGFNIGMNLGRAAGAGIPGHLHQHIVPRWSGDTNFMPVLAECRVIPEHLDATYLDLSEGFVGGGR